MRACSSILAGEDKAYHFPAYRRHLHTRVTLNTYRIHPTQEGTEPNHTVSDSVTTSDKRCDCSVWGDVAREVVCGSVKERVIRCNGFICLFAGAQMSRAKQERDKC